MSRPDSSRALVFGRVADDYARTRPTYPDEAVTWMLSAAARRVAELGAGTGQLTSALLKRGVAVEAVEPDPEMANVLRRSFPAARTHEALSHELPLEDSSVDAVLVADAWHWFGFDATVAEVKRVLRPGGWLALVWNVVTPREPWEYTLAGIDPDKKGTAAQATVPLPFPKSEMEVASFPWTWEVTPELFGVYLTTNSAVILMEEHDRARRVDESVALLEAVRQERGTETVPLHHEASCFKWTPTL